LASTATTLPGWSSAAALAAASWLLLRPVRNGDAVGHGRLHQQDLLVLLGHRQHGQRHRAGGGADGDVDLVVGVGRGQRRLAHVGLALVVLLDHHQLAAGHGHGAAGGVLQAHVEAHDGLLGVGFQRAGLAGDEGDLHVLAGLRERGGSGHTGSCQGQHGQGRQGKRERAALHGRGILPGGSRQTGADRRGWLSHRNRRAVFTLLVQTLRISAETGQGVSVLPRIVWKSDCGRCSAACF